jgi:aspartyl-tRNA(Asn)/glutamyl-tRNA(Gln) amidotransferase subunit B
MGFTANQRYQLKYETPRQREERRKKFSRLMDDWKLSVAFQVHLQIKSKYKMFSTARCETNAAPNTHANFVDLALPGMLPVLNEHCLNQAVKASLALGGRILPQIKFDRKHYTFCDLPQSYQITQKHYPIMLDGRLFYYDYNDHENYILIDRMQMEHDTAKTI